ncbi:hypothetical protein [Xanthomonas arboricola]|uniref:hypothetical protein n=1 Tax=Xanthomonas arboricola TaxID=56448 RepID=UPI000F8EACBC|nr:hypothetical protein [Xanthomonas arboricola]
MTSNARPAVQTLPLDMESARSAARTALGEIEPAGVPRSNNEPNALMLSARTDSGGNLPPPFLVYFLLVDLLEFPRMGRWEKTAWTVPIRFHGKLYGIEHRKMGLGIFAPTLAPGATMSARPSVEAEADALEISRLVTEAIEVSRPYFAWRASQAASTSKLNVLNKSSTLFERYGHFRHEWQRLVKEAENTSRRSQSEQSITEPNQLFSRASMEIALAAYECSQKATWSAQAAIEAFFAWTEHAFIHLAILQNKLHLGSDVAALAIADWKTKFKAALDLSDSITKSHYDGLLDIRAQLRNFLAHGAFGKNGEAFQFHSDAGAVPLLLTEDQHHRYALTSNPAFKEESALAAIDNFIEHLWSGKRLPARRYLFSDLPSILTLAVDGTYEKCMRSEHAMNELVERLTHQFDAALNMDW